MSSTPCKVVAIAGASGLIGSALSTALRARGFVVRRLVRHVLRTADEISWDPATDQLDPASLAGVDAIVNLAGANIAGGRWTEKRRRLIVESRTATARTLLEAMAQMPQRPSVYVSASATGFYGSRGDDVLTEESPSGEGFLADVCRAWEAPAPEVARLGVREVRMRFGVVLAREGGALTKMLPLFRLGLGGRLGDGRQWMSWVAIEDVCPALMRAIEDERWTGAYNVTSPEPVTNAVFTAALGRALHRPTLLPAPAWGLRLVFGAMADEALLGSTRAVPRRLSGEGFVFRFPRIDDALRAAVAPVAT